MNIKLLFFFSISIFLLICTKTNAQYTNDWIKYDQDYYKIPVVDQGIYRIPQSQLQAYGFPSTVDPRKIQLFYRGVEQAIKIFGEDDGSLDNGDYLEFFGKKIDGFVDHELYYPQYINHLNPEANMYSDTTAYFITYSKDGSLGKRMATIDVPNAGLATESYHLQNDTKVLAEQVTAGRNLISKNSFVFISSYDRGEGVTSKFLAPSQKRDFKFDIDHKITSVTKPTLNIKYVSRSNTTSKMTVSVGTSVSTLREIGTFGTSLYGIGSFTHQLELSDLPTLEGELVVRVKNESGYISINSIQLLYAQSFHANNQAQKYFFLNQKSSSKSYIEIAGAPTGGQLYDITKPEELRIVSTTNTSTLNATIDNTNTKRTLFLTNNFKNTLPIKKVTFKEYDLTANYLIISHRKLMQPSNEYNNPVQAYSDYRSSPEGGGFKTEIADIEELYNQFSYGEYNPIAIKNFCKYIYDKGAPEYVFLIGKAITNKAIDPSFNSYAVKYDLRHNPAHRALNLVPTYGYPGSDIPFTAGLDNEYKYAPSIPIGRIPADEAQEVSNYLDKVKEYETPKGDIYKKNFLYLSGGNYKSERITFRKYLENYAKIARDKEFGAISTQFIAKKTNDPVEFLNVSDQINEGVGFLTFFGHSGVNHTDIDIGKVSEDVNGYHNKGKYTFIYANGCSIGDVYSNKVTLAEDWLFTRDKGAIGWWAISQLGGAPWLNSYSVRTYITAFNNPRTASGIVGDSLFGESMGRVHRSVARTYTRNLGIGLNLAHVQQMALQADPAIKIFSGPKPDYYTEDAWLSIVPVDEKEINAQTEKFRLKLYAANLALTSDKPLFISVKRTLSSGEVIDYTAQVPYDPIDRLDTLYFDITKPEGVSVFGNNKFEVMLDYKNDIDENRENNNVAVLEYFFPDIGVKCLYPTEYSIVSKQSVKLVAQNGNLEFENKEILFEIDTSYYFDSPYKQRKVVPFSSLPNWEVDLIPDAMPSDSTVYYWRVNYADAVNDANLLWDQSSFVYIKNSPGGWAQMQFPQFFKSKDKQIRKNKQNSTWEFATIKNRIRVTTFGSTNPEAVAADFNNVLLYLNDLAMVYPSNPLKCYNNRLIALMIDGDTKKPKGVNNVGLCGRRPALVNSFDAISIGNGSFDSWYSKADPQDIIIILNKGKISQQIWDDARPTLEKIGGSAAALVTLKEGHPYILVGKGNGDLIKEVISPSIADATDSDINLDIDLSGGLDNGTVTSTTIGPATKWGYLQHYMATAESPSVDEKRVDIIGITLDGTETVILSDADKETFISHLDADAYPYIKLQMTTSDSRDATPAQLDKWVVTYTSVPEGFLNPDNVKKDAYKPKKSTEGEVLKIPFSYENIADKNFTVDSLDVQYTIISHDQNTKTEKTFKIKAPKIAEKTDFEVTLDTEGLDGSNTMRVYVNPKVVVEQYYDNNILEVKVDVEGDDRNPLLDVTFDGIKILDGEIVSPSPLIDIRLRDDNLFLSRTDTVGLDLALKGPCDDCVFEKVYFSDPNLRWSQEAGVYNVTYHPQKLSDGIYTLRVQGNDAKGNVAGVKPYQISFEVINASTVTNFFPYPNPFSGSTRFVFTLTGGEIPQEIKIQIMTVTGKVVREITQDELGPLRIGNNKSEYAWDGTDEFGDKLANGVYLYKVNMKLNGEGMDKRETSADRGFKQGFGKLYILR